MQMLQQHPPTRVVGIQHMVTLDDLQNDDEYNDFVDDTLEECSQFGQVLSVIIPRATEIGATKAY
jgi:splicing factor U2AF 65 kDa subunit